MTYVNQIAKPDTGMGRISGGQFIGAAD